MTTNPLRPLPPQYGAVITGAPGGISTRYMHQHLNFRASGHGPAAPHARTITLAWESTHAKETSCSLEYSYDHSLWLW